MTIHEFGQENEKVRMLANNIVKIQSAVIDGGITPGYVHYFEKLIRRRDKCNLKRWGICQERH
ncbi:hypothetical protein [Butyrivibrio sp. WCD2001]|uniref:hypothetical protein n=1 Tax=Butyrivibrio sp. WCD2001 TaxID=1280681 RepID=UPI0018C93DA9|nr:hypothetical protein [Butyrivibrio sp. WCD2001]